MASSPPTSWTSVAARPRQVMADGLEIILGDPEVKSVFVNVFGASPPATLSQVASCRQWGCSLSVATRWTSPSCAASMATTPRRVAGSSTRPNTM